MNAVRKGRQLLRQVLHDDLLRPGSRSSSLVHRFPFVIGSALAVVGVLCDSIWFVSLSTNLFRWAMIAVVAGLLPLLVQVVQRRRRQPPRPQWRGLTWGCNAVLAICVFGSWHAFREATYRNASIVDRLHQPSQPVVVRGKLDRTVSLRRNPLSFGRLRDEVSPWQSQLTVEVHQVRTADGFVPVDGKVLVYVDGDLSQRRPGDELEVYGWLKAFSAPTNPGEPDLRPSYRRRGLHGRIETKNAGAVTVLAETNRPISTAIAGIATRGRQSLLRHTDEQTGALAIALVLGQREFVDPKTRDSLLATGTAHLLSVSGMHLAILVLVATWGLSAVGLRPISRFAVIVAISALYVAVTGGRPPVFRAAILIAVLLLSTCFRRTSQPINTLGVAAMVLILINPTNVFSIGVHLSFLAVITLMLAGRPIAPGSMRNELEMQRESGFQTLIEESRGAWFRHGKTLLRFFMQMAWLSACVTGVSLPLVWSQFHLVSIVSVLTNVLVWGGLMIALPMGVLTVIADPIHYGLGVVPGMICHGALRYMWLMIQWTESWPGGHVWLPAPPPALVLVFYAVMGGSLLWRSHTARWFRIGWVVTWGLATLLIVTRPGPLPPATLEATFIDVGHGTSVIVRTPDQKVWLYDCGRMGNSDGTSRDIDTALWALGVTHLDGVFLSHADADHYNSFPALAERFSIDSVLTPPSMLATAEGGLAAIVAAIDRHQIEQRELAAGAGDDQIGGRSMAVLHPPAGGVGGNDNANSMVLQIDHGGRVLLLPGDLEPPGTESLVSQPRPPAGGVMMAPHHGSLSMNADAVLAWARPRETIVSGSRRAARLEVREMLSVTGSGVHVTADQGAVRVRMGGSAEIEVLSWLAQPW